MIHVVLRDGLGDNSRQPIKRSISSPSYLQGGRSVHICILDSLKFNLEQANEVRYPILAQIAHDYLPVQGSSIPSESVFSSTGLGDNKRRGKTAQNVWDSAVCQELLQGPLSPRGHFHESSGEGAATCVAWTKIPVVQ